MQNETNFTQDRSPGVIARAPWRVAKVEALPDYHLKVCFNDGSEGFVDMSRLIFSENAGVFAVLKENALFEQVYLELGVVTWPGEIDLAPDAMYQEIKLHGKWILN